MTDSDRTVWHLARLAECFDPDSDTSPGAGFLRSVEAAAVADLPQYGDRTDGIHELADSCVPVYTAERWAVFADLGAWQEDLTGYIDPSDSDMTRAAGVALYLISERLLYALSAETADETADGGGPHVGHFSRLGGTWWCDICNSPYCDRA